jgi:hypothetical protein
MPYLSDKSYLALKVEATEGTAVKPDVFIPLVSESIESDLKHEADRRFKGRDWKSDDLNRGGRTHKGDLVLFGDPDNLGHCLNMCMKKGTTTVGAGFYTHPFTPEASKSYTIEIGKGLYAQRYYGVKGNSIKLDFVDGRMQVTLNVSAMGQVSVGTLADAHAGATTSILLKTDYDLTPYTGLVVGDVLNVGTTTITISGFTAPNQINFLSTAITASIGDRVSLALQTPSWGTLREPLFLGNTLVGFGATETLATTASATKATATPCYELSINKLQNVLDAPSSGSIDPLKIIAQTQEGALTISQMFESETQHQSWLDRIKQAITIVSKGQVIGSGQENLTWKCHKVKLLTSKEPLAVGAYIFENQEFEMLYDAGDAKAISVELTNSIAGTVY